MTYYGAVTQDVLGDIFRKHEVFVLPSYYEGLPLVVLESLACGMRVVVNEFPALIELLSETINESGWVEYVKQPRLENIDQPLESDLSAYCDRLAEALKKTKRGEPVKEQSFRMNFMKALRSTLGQDLLNVCGRRFSNE